MSVAASAGPEHSPRYPQPYTLAQLRAGRRDPFRVPGLVHSSLTGFVGEPYAGKSSLSANLIASAVQGADFLDVPWDEHPDRIVLVCTDPGNAAEYSDRLEELGVTDDDGRVVVFESAPMSEGWADVRQDFALTPSSLVIVDNLMGVSPDVNSTKDVGGFFDAVQHHLCTHGVAVVVIAHKSEKYGERGKARTPMGSTAISAKFRHVVYVDPREGSGIALRVRGNQVSGEQLWTLSRGGGAADLHVTSTEAVVPRNRSKEIHDRNANVADFLVTECGGLSKKDAAAKAAPVFHLTPGTLEKHMGPSGPVGTLVRREGSEWVRRE